MDRDERDLRAGYLGMAVVLLGAVLYGFSLDRYPGYYVDDSFFAFPALKAIHGGTFTYLVATSAPFADKLWAYHGPLLPYLYLFLFRVFGFSVAISRLPEFAGGWLAALLMVVFLTRRGYPKAALLLSLLWCGDRAPQEIMYGRMDGLALLFLVLAFVLLERGFRKQERWAVFSCGVCCGLAALANPFCVSFALTSWLIAAYWMQWRGALWFGLGLALNAPVLLAMWHFQPVDAVTQFLWHAGMLQGETARHSFLVMIAALRWSRFWFLALVVFSAGYGIVTMYQLIRGAQPRARSDFFLVLAAAFGITGLAALFRASTHPYYIVYFSMWPMLCVAVLAETRWRQFRYLLLAMGAIWCTSAAWNLERIKESILFHSKLSSHFLYAELRKDVPPDAQIDTIPEMYSVPILAGFQRYDLTTWFAQRQDTCPACYLLITQSEFTDPHYILRSNLAQRRILYTGPAFPGPGPMSYPIVLLSPETLGAR